MCCPIEKNKVTYKNRHPPIYYAIKQAIHGHDKMHNIYKIEPTEQNHFNFKRYRN